MAIDPTKQTIKNFILDVDGVLTDGRFYYTTEGKMMKTFGDHDHDALLLLMRYIPNVLMITGDKRGFAITKKRVEEDMKFPLHEVSTFERAEWIKERFNADETAYMGDGIFDAMVFDEVAYGIAPANAFHKIKEHADFVTEARAGQGAVAEASWHLIEKFFEPLDALNLGKLKKGQGLWGK